MSNPRNQIGPQGEAVLAWLQGLDGPGATPVMLNQLRDGHRIWAILQDLSPEEFAGALPEPLAAPTGKWLASWQNLKHVTKHLAQFVATKHGRLPASWRALDLKALAAGDGPASGDAVKAILTADARARVSDADVVLQLLKMVLFVAVKAENNERYIQTIINMSADRQKYLQDAIMEVSPVPSPLLSETDDV